ncbi:hypothetical protein DYB34_007273 [Aphanomyces astaci]|uniref:ubiquitinyl hydrolase 1 n=1 Tax=Aphanomyces astaci TaxID=112090 RepID=A0A418BDU5_APHAT|nr:hypothetical protein DYB34_007273 [Aphanomyces astaci]
MEPDTSTDSSSSISTATLPKSSSTTPSLNESDKRRRLLQDQPPSTHMEATGPPLNPQQSGLLRIVYEDLRKQATVGWHNAVNAFEIAHAHLHEAEVQEFLQLCFAQIVNIMLDQMTSKMAVTEKNCVIRTLTKGTVLCLAQLQNPHTSPPRRLAYFSHMALILNKQKHFYKEFRGSNHHMMGQYWNKSPAGCPEVRLQCLALFHEHHGFSMLTRTLDQHVADADKAVAFIQTVSMDDLKLLLQGLYDLRVQVDSTLIRRLLQSLLQLVLVLPSAELKKEPTDSIGHMLHLIQRLLDQDKNLQDALLLVIGRFIESTSLPQRLFGFEQLGSVVQVARRSMPLPLSYRVAGAGSELVNGVYQLVPPTTSSAGTYIKQPTSSSSATISKSRHAPPSTPPPPGGPHHHPMTLFCCTMKNGSKMWFLSEADQAQPGTDQDIDYYHHQSVGDDVVPPLSHWVPTGQGVAPSPLLIPHRPRPTAVVDSTRLDQRVLSFVWTHKLLDEIFGDRIHREIVVRSASLLRFLAEAGQLSDEHVQHVYASATGKEESLVAEIHTLLVTSVLVYLSDDQVVSFLSFLLAQPVHLLPDVALFMDKVAGTYRSILHRVEAGVTSKCLRLLWRLQNASDPQLHSAADVLELFHTALQSPAGEKERALFVNECIHMLRVSAQTTTTWSADQEAATTRSLELLKVLLESCSGNDDDDDDDDLVDHVNATYNLVQLLFDELAAFVQRHTLESALRHRLDLIHYVHGKSNALEMTQAQVRSLWTVLSKQRVYRDLCWQFLTESSVFASDNVAPFNVAVCEYIFNDLLCNPHETDFSALSEAGFACFHMYFVGVNAHHHHLIRSTTTTTSPVMSTNAIRRIVSFESLIGLDALWQVAIYGLPAVSKAAIVELLNVYVQVTDSIPATQHFLQHVFDVLQRASSSADVVQHCMHLLTGYMHQSPIGAGAIVHGKRSRGAPLSLQCTVQRLPTSVSAEKPPAFTLHVSANETLGRVRQLVEAQLGHPLTQTKLLVQGTPLVGDAKTWRELALTDPKQTSTEVTVVLFQTNVAKDLDGLDDSNINNQQHQQPLLHLGTLLSQSEAYFDVLFGLLDRYQGQNDTHAIVLDVVANVPTQTTLLDMVSQPLDRPDSLQRWLATSSYHKAVYVLEIIDGCLMPVHGAASQAYVTSFIQHGLDRVVHFLFETPRVDEQGMAVAMRLVKYCVLHSNHHHPPLSQQRTNHLSTAQMASLMTQLSALVWRSSLAPRVVIDALQIMQAISVYVPFEFPDPWPMPSTLLHPEEPIRVQWLATLQSQPHNVTKQLVAPALHTLQHALPVTSDRGTQLFALVAFLVPQFSPDQVEALEAALVALFQPTMSTSVLLGSLAILHTLCAQPSLSSRARQQILDVLYDKSLFASGAKCLCASADTRKAAYGVVAQLASAANSTTDDLHAKLTSLINATSTSSTSSWGQEVNVVARGQGDHVGLKNQGCSCYMNSFLQQLFMYPPIRHGLLAATIPVDRFPEIPESQLNLPHLVHTDPTSLIGRRIMNEANNGRSFEAVITGYDHATKMHLIKYDEGSTDVRLKLWGKEAMNRVTLLPPTLQGDEATVEVLRQVQRTFWYLQESEMRYFNPKALVEACKCLNLEFSVYQQNDASEFCDKLLDRLEIGLAKTPQGTACLQSHLGGKLISQKLPKGCGHRFEREEAFIRLELQIRGKESIDESLAAFVEGELMDGDNKVECELCGEKKAAIRRTCFGALPQLLVLHLKRFDLDYATFETVKLNNRCAFPLKLDMKPYTKRGLDEKAAEDVDDDIGGMDDDDNDDEYMYELRGVLVHAGVAQGGHYYSFIKDQSVGKWFKYDDEDVSAFDPANIEAECFGGMQKRTSSWNGMTNTMEMEVFSNALMLFYEKVVRRPESPTNSTTTVSMVHTNPMAQQVWAANDLFLRHSYVFDTAFDEFMKQVVATHQDQLKWLQLGVQFVLSIVLRFREKKGFGRWVDLFHGAFATTPAFAAWFLEVPDLSVFFTECPDPMARPTVVGLLTRAAAAVVATSPPDDPAALVHLSARVADWCVPPLMDEYFTLIFHIASLSPVLREQFQRHQMVSRLIHVLLGTRSYARLVHAYGPLAGEAPLECQALFDAIGALLGLTRNAPEPLLAEQAHASSSTQPRDHIVLSARAQSALTSLFHEYCTDDHVMGVKELQKYFRVCGTTVATAKVTAKKIKTMLSKWPQLDLSAWLEYYTELGATSSKQVLSDLKAHGFRDNLQRPPSVHDLEPASSLLDNLPALCREAIVHEVFIEAALEEDAEAVADLLVRVSLGSPSTSSLVIKSVLTALFHAELGWKGLPIVDAAVQILTQLLTFEANNNENVALIELTMVQTSYSLLVAAAERKKVYAQYGTAPALFIYRYVTILMDLHKVPRVASWLQAHVGDWMWMYEWLRLESLKPSLGGRVTVLYRDPSKLETLLALGELLHVPFTPEEKSYAVSGAGCAAVNGVYHMVQHQRHDGCPVFRMTNHDIEYTLFRCEMPSKTHRWYISHAENRQTLGTVTDVDFYYCLCTIHEETPPEDGWKVWTKNPDASGPTPTVTLQACSVSADELDMTVHAPPHSHGGSSFVVPEVDMDDDTVEYEDSEEEIRVSNERFQAVHLESPSEGSSGRL